jgi:hypothetical protein
MKDSKHTCEHCGAELTVSEVVTYNHDDGGSIDSIDIDYEVDECYDCLNEAFKQASLAEEDELPF